jgi:hypothetical protein
VVAYHAAQDALQHRGRRARQEEEAERNAHDRGRRQPPGRAEIDLAPVAGQDEDGDRAAHERHERRRRPETTNPADRVAHAAPGFVQLVAGAGFDTDSSDMDGWEVVKVA